MMFTNKKSDKKFSNILGLSLAMFLSAGGVIKAAPKPPVVATNNSKAMPLISKTMPENLPLPQKFAKFVARNKLAAGLLTGGATLAAVGGVLAYKLTSDSDGIPKNVEEIQKKFNDLHSLITKFRTSEAADKKKEFLEKAIECSKELNDFVVVASKGGEQPIPLGIPPEQLEEVNNFRREHPDSLKFTAASQKVGGAVSLLLPLQISSTPLQDLQDKANALLINSQIATGNVTPESIKIFQENVNYVLEMSKKNQEVPKSEQNKSAADSSRQISIKPNEISQRRNNNEKSKKDEHPSEPKVDDQKKLQNKPKKTSDIDNKSSIDDSALSRDERKEKFIKGLNSKADKHGICKLNLEGYSNVLLLDAENASKIFDFFDGFGLMPDDKIGDAFFVLESVLKQNYTEVMKNEKSKNNKDNPNIENLQELFSTFAVEVSKSDFDAIMKKIYPSEKSHFSCQKVSDAISYFDPKEFKNLVDDNGGGISFYYGLAKVLFKKNDVDFVMNFDLTYLENNEEMVEILDDKFKNLEDKDFRDYTFGNHPLTKDLLKLSINLLTEESLRSLDICSVKKILERYEKTTDEGKFDDLYKKKLFTKDEAVQFSFLLMKYGEESKRDYYHNLLIQALGLDGGEGIYYTLDQNGWQQASTFDKINKNKEFEVSDGRKVKSSLVKALFIDVKSPAFETKKVGIFTEEDNQLLVKKVLEISKKEVNKNTPLESSEDIVAYFFNEASKSGNLADEEIENLKLDCQIYVNTYDIEKNIYSDKKNSLEDLEKVLQTDCLRKGFDLPVSFQLKGVKITLNYEQIKRLCKVLGISLRNVKDDKENIIIRNLKKQLEYAIYNCFSEEIEKEFQRSRNGFYVEVVQKKIAINSENFEALCSHLEEAKNADWANNYGEYIAGMEVLDLSVPLEEQSEDVFFKYKNHLWSKKQCALFCKLREKFELPDGMKITFSSDNTISKHDFEVKLLALGKEAYPEADDFRCYGRIYDNTKSENEICRILLVCHLEGINARELNSSEPLNAEQFTAFLLNMPEFNNHSMKEFFEPTQYVTLEKYLKDDTSYAISLSKNLYLKGELIKDIIRHTNHEGMLKDKILIGEIDEKIGDVIGDGNDLDVKTPGIRREDLVALTFKLYREEKIGKNEASHFLETLFENHSYHGYDYYYDCYHTWEEYASRYCDMKKASDISENSFGWWEIQFRNKNNTCSFAMKEKENLFNIYKLINKGSNFEYRHLNKETFKRDISDFFGMEFEDNHITITKNKAPDLLNDRKDVICYLTQMASEGKIETNYYNKLIKDVFDENIPLSKKFIGDKNKVFENLRILNMNACQHNPQEIWEFGDKSYTGYELNQLSLRIGIHNNDFFNVNELLKGDQQISIPSDGPFDNLEQMIKYALYLHHENEINKKTLMRIVRAKESEICSKEQLKENFRKGKNYYHFGNIRFKDHILDNFSLKYLFEKECVNVEFSNVEFSNDTIAGILYSKKNKKYTDENELISDLNEAINIKDNELTDLQLVQKIFLSNLERLKFKDDSNLKLFLCGKKINCCNIQNVSNLKLRANNFVLEEFFKEFDLNCVYDLQKVNLGFDIDKKVFKKIFETGILSQKGNLHDGGNLKDLFFDCTEIGLNLFLRSIVDLPYGKMNKRDWKFNKRPWEWVDCLLGSCRGNLECDELGISNKTGYSKEDFVTDVSKLLLYIKNNYANTVESPSNKTTLQAFCDADLKIFNLLPTKDYAHVRLIESGIPDKFLAEYPSFFHQKDDDKFPNNISLDTLKNDFVAEKIELENDNIEKILAQLALEGSDSSDLYKNHCKEFFFNHLFILVMKREITPILLNKIVDFFKTEVNLNTLNDFTGSIGEFCQKKLPNVTLKDIFENKTVFKDVIEKELPLGFGFDEFITIRNNSNDNISVKKAWNLCEVIEKNYVIEFGKRYSADSKNIKIHALTLLKIENRINEDQFREIVSAEAKSNISTTEFMKEKIGKTYIEFSKIDDIVFKDFHFILEDSRYLNFEYDDSLFKTICSCILTDDNKFIDFKDIYFYLCKKLNSANKKFSMLYNNSMIIRKKEDLFNYLPRILALYHNQNVSIDKMKAYFNMPFAATKFKDHIRNTLLK